MEHVDGGELFDYIVDNNGVDELTACKFFHDLINGIQYCHGVGVTHRDIKPENILLDKDIMQLKLADFGLGAIYKPNNLLNTFCGSPCYASPEMV